MTCSDFFHVYLLFGIPAVWNEVTFDNLVSKVTWYRKTAMDMPLTTLQKQLPPVRAVPILAGWVIISSTGFIFY